MNHPTMMAGAYEIGGAGSGTTDKIAAIKFVKRRYEQDGWTVHSVEVEKVGYDLHCDRGPEQLHVEVKGTQGDNVCFIITAAEVRNAMIDRNHLTCVGTTALATTPKMFTLTRDDFDKKIQLDPIAFRAQLLAEEHGFTSAHETNINW